VRRGKLKEVERSGFDNGLGAALHTQLATQVVDVSLHGVDAQNETTGDLSI
jgi:hypothetical protein